jgi:hypothetical protein
MQTTFTDINRQHMFDEIKRLGVSKRIIIEIGFSNDESCQLLRLFKEILGLDRSRVVAQ